jgi:hypothetical protein
MRQFSYRIADSLDNSGVPRPDGTALGNLRHVIDIYDSPDDRVILTATSNVYEPGVTTDLTMGYLREIAQILGVKRRSVIDDV